jgi:diacylglycerol kinase
MDNKRQSAVRRPTPEAILYLLRITRSFIFAFAGLAHLMRTQPNFGVHLLAALLVGGVGFLLGLRGAELAALALAIGLVLVVEAVNTALEAVVNLTSPEVHPLARIAKDVGAAAVLLAAATAVVVGFVLLLPRLVALFM